MRHHLRLLQADFEVGDMSCRQVLLDLGKEEDLVNEGWSD